MKVTMLSNNKVHFFILFSLLMPTFLLSDAQKFLKKIESLALTDLVDIQTKATATKQLTIIFYLAGVNNLGYFLRKNLSQLAEVGSTKNINILVQLDVLLPGHTKATKRYYVEKNKLVILNQNDPATQSMDSGDPNSLISWCAYCVEHYSAQNYILVLSNHGTGCIDIGQTRALNPSQLFTFNPATNMIELNRSQPFLELIASPESQRGICFDDITAHYLTNQKLDHALKTVCTKHIKGKFKITIFDACLQQMYEMGLLLQPYTELVLGSEEVVLAPGLDYYDILKPFENKKIDFLPFAKHIIASYDNTYKKITHDYTFSAVDLTTIHLLERNVTTVATLLIEGLSNKKSSFMRDAIKTSRHKFLCTHFDEPSYIDLHHFYSNLVTNLQRSLAKAEIHDQKLKSTVGNLITALNEGLTIIKHVVVANVAGKNVSQAQGLSIYFPEYGNKHPSYKYFSHAWSIFLDHYLMA